MTDTYKKQAAYPTYLFFNPYQETKTVETNVGKDKTDVYDTVSRRFLLRGVRGKIQFSIAADAACVLVFVPSGKTVVVEKGQLKVGGLPIDFRYQK